MKLNFWPIAAILLEIVIETFILCPGHVDYGKYLLTKSLWIFIFLFPIVDT